MNEKQATPREQLIQELLDSRVPKTEREHCAAREIERLRARIAELEADAARYRYLRNRDAAYVLKTTGPAAGCWIDCDGEDGGLCLLTGEDADAAIDALRGEK